MNEYDSGSMENYLIEKGYTPAGDYKHADIIIINTCSVRAHAENRALSQIGHLEKLKLHRPDLLLVVAGCMAERMKENLKKRFPYIDLVLGAKDIPHLEDKLDHLLCESIESNISSTPDISFSKLKAFVSIMRGCNNYCSYCIVPYVRGNEASRKAEDIVSEIKQLALNGCREITLLGQNVNSYSSFHNRRKYHFSDILVDINNINGIQRIRFFTSHPKDMSDELIFAIRDMDKVCEHIHLPVQSGSNNILKLMNRQYSREQYLELVCKIKSEIPGVSLSTDIIVGFPGETEQDFEDTLNLVRQVSFDAAYTFKYSPRPLTKASELEDSVPLDTKKKRLLVLNELQEKLSRDKNTLLLNNKLEVLVEGKEPKGSDRLIGRTRSHKIVIFEGASDIVGKLQKVEITSAGTWSLYGKIIS